MLRLKKVGKVYYASGTVAGRRIRKSTGTGHEPTARKEARRIEAEIWKERHDPQAGKITFEVAATDYMQADGERRFLAPLLQHFRGVDITTIKSGHVQDAARAIYPNCKPATLNRQAITPTQAVLNFAAERGWCQPIKVSRFTEEPAPRKAGDREWLDAFMSAAEDELGTLALFMFTTGARVSDALRIEAIEGRYVRMETKTGPRTAIMSRELMLRMRGPFRWQHRWSIYKPWKKACRDAGIEYLSPHQAGRHAFATEMIVRRGVDPMTTRDLGGWKSTRMLERYAHPEGLEDVIDTVFGRNLTDEKKVIDNKGKK